jgi:hypothetical protein
MELRFSLCLISETNDIAEENRHFLTCCKQQIWESLRSQITCLIPGLEEIVPSQQDKFICSNQTLAADTYKKYKETTMNFLRYSVRCPVPCRQQSFDVKVDFFDKNSFIDVDDTYPQNVLDSTVFVSICYSSILIETRVETYLYDLGNFLTSAGGNLGLLLGFSCLSVFFILLKCLKRSL